MKAHGIRLIRGLIAATVTAADEQVLHLYGMNKADNQGFSALMGKPRPDWRWSCRVSRLRRVAALLVVSGDSWLVSGFEPLFGTRFYAHAPS
jgi:hypothetical protein